MQFGKRRQSDRMALIEITPMIDVVFLLIIFFMTTAQFAKETRAELDLPKERGEQLEQSEEAGIIVNLDATGGIIVDQELMSLDELELILRDRIDVSGGDASTVKLVLRADRRGSTANLNQVISMLRELGIGAARVATEVP